MDSDTEMVEKARKAALKMMKDAGFEISDPVQVVIDHKLSFMGYLTRKDGKDVIVIACRALNSEMIEGLLVHEMSHLYQTRMHHPSHNHELLGRVERHVLGKNDLKADYQLSLIQDAVNHVQDLYADDIAFKVFNNNEAFQNKRVFEFFQSWIAEEPLEGRTPRTAWLNMGIMLNNCFILSNIVRHGLTDVDNQAQNKIQKFLSQMNDRVNEEFLRFKDYMVNLSEDPVEEEFEKDLMGYLEQVIELAKELVQAL